MPKRVDSNQKEIVALLRDLGASVAILSDIGKGCPDILVGFKGANYLLEIKNGKSSKSAQKLTPHEQTFFEEWQGQVSIINSLDEALKFFRNLVLGKQHGEL